MPAGPRAPAGGHGLLCDSLRQRGHAFRRQPQQALRRRRDTAAAVTEQWLKGERRMTEKAMAHSGKPGGSEDAAAASSAATPMAAARHGAERSERQGVRGAMERRERRRGPLGQAVMEDQEHDSRQGTRQRRAAMVGRELCMAAMPSPFGEFPRSRGRRRHGHIRTKFWASSRHIRF